MPAHKKSLQTSNEVRAKTTHGKVAHEPRFFIRRASLPVLYKK